LNPAHLRHWAITLEAVAFLLRNIVADRAGSHWTFLVAALRA